ncbi:SGNH/GDSL hydrolase family protein [Aliarcobacter butzleri]|uniref:hypothetical protein n=1 Tax=Aliarcobacter butzleri TaxID=28197 RepID=UPI002B2550B7|nr:hypothetical protein [Aliarcobacter butzleri]
MIFGNGEICNSKENKIIKSDLIENYDFLLFFDSRAMLINEKDYKNSFFYKLIEIFNKKSISYIAISRPKNLTVFSTIINFLQLNKNLKFINLITNVGFVDCTPKKYTNIEDINIQISQFSKICNEIIKFGNYELNGGETEVLHSIKYSKEYINELNTLFHNCFKQSYFINTPLVLENIEMKRKRPKSFFSQLETTNSLINELVSIDINKNRLIDISKIIHTYDGVHYTNTGHKKIYEKIIEELNL